MLVAFFIALFASASSLQLKNSTVILDQVFDIYENISQVLERAQSDSFDSADDIDEYFQNLMQQVDESFDNVAQQGLTQIDNFITYLNTVENVWFENSTENAEYELEKEYFEEDFADADENEEIEEARNELHDVEKANQNYLEYIILEALSDGSNSFQDFLDDVDEEEEDKMEDVDELWHDFLDQYQEIVESIYDLKEDLLEDLQFVAGNLSSQINSTVQYIESDNYYIYLDQTPPQSKIKMTSSNQLKKSVASDSDLSDDTNLLQFEERKKIYKQKFLEHLPAKVKDKFLEDS